MAAGLDLPSSGSHGATTPLSVLVDTIEALSSTRTIEAVADVVRSAARRVSGADGVAFVLRDGDFCHYLDEDAISPLWKGRRFPIETCITGWAMTRSETVVIREIREDPRIPQDAYRPTFVRSLVITPVRASNPLGAIGAYWDHPRDPTAAEVESLSVMARATATAIENVGLLASLESSLARREALIRELDHRVKNTLAATLSIANQTLPGSDTPGAFVEGFNGRVMALSRAHELLAARDWEGGELGAILADVLAEEPAFQAGRIRLSGPNAWMPTETTVSFVLALHELVDNARRHGALSGPAGTIEVTWAFGEGGAGDFALVWTERGGPPTSPPGRRGFGLRLAELGLARDLGGKVRVDFEPAGLTYSLTAPRSRRIAPA